MPKDAALEKVKKDFKAMIETIDAHMGKGYATKNPAMVQHLLGVIQSEEDRDVTRRLHSLDND